MYEYRYPQNDFLLTVHYNGEYLRVKIKQYHTEPGASYWHLFSLNKVHELKWVKDFRTICQVLACGENPMPPGFLALLQKEFESIFPY